MISRPAEQNEADQWYPDDPTLQAIGDDITRKIVYVSADGNDISGNCCIIIGDDPANRKIEGK